jgi:hypothetical protein
MLYHGINMVPIPVKSTSEKSRNKHGTHETKEIVL